MKANDIPTIQARRITRQDGVRLLVFICAECGRSITHGWPQGDTLPTHRLAHCNCYARGYYLTETTQTQQTKGGQ